MAGVVARESLGICARSRELRDGLPHGGDGGLDVLFCVGQAKEHRMAGVQVVAAGEPAAEHRQAAGLVLRLDVRHGLGRQASEAIAQAAGLTGGVDALDQPPA